MWWGNEEEKNRKQNQNDWMEFCQSPEIQLEKSQRPTVKESSCGLWSYQLVLTSLLLSSMCKREKEREIQQREFSTQASNEPSYQWSTGALLSRQNTRFLLYVRTALIRL